LEIAVACGREVDQPAAIAQQRRNSVDQDKVAKMIGPKLRLKAIRRVAEGIWPSRLRWR